jgi:hypothetical protein
LNDLFPEQNTAAIRHPRSPIYRAGHQAWVRGEPAPFLPGAVIHTLVLAPSAGH